MEQTKAVRKAKSYEIDMCSGAILPKMLQFAFPLMLSGVLQLMFNAVDVIVVGRFAGDNALAAETMLWRRWVPQASWSIC